MMAVANNHPAMPLALKRKRQVPALQTKATSQCSVTNAVTGARHVDSYPQEEEEAQLIDVGILFWLKC